MKLYSFAKNAGLTLARGAGVFRAVENSAWRNQRLLILCYHGISLADEHEWSPALYLDARTFRRRLEILRDGGYHVLPFHDAWERLGRNQLPPKSVAITFDDGMHDFLVHAAPLLEEFGFPATLYLTTYYCLNQIPIFDPFCFYLLWKAKGRRVDLSGLLPEAGEVVIPTAETGIRALHRRFYQYVRQESLSAAAKDALLGRLCERLQIDGQSLRRQRMLYIMPPEEVQAVSKSGLITIELHTHRHRTPRDQGLFMRELDDNARVITDITGRQPRHFCYPSGDYTAEFFPWLAGFGALTATTCETGFASAADSPYRLPRLLDMETITEAGFQGWLSGFNGRLR